MGSLKYMDHGRYQRLLTQKTSASLRYIIKDARGAMDANPSNPNNGYYADEISYCSMELNRRNK